MTQQINSRSGTADGQDYELTREEWLKKLENRHVQRADIDRLVMNYLVTEGFKEAAEEFRAESGIQPVVELDTLDDRVGIRDAIQNGKIQEAIELVNRLHPELFDSNRYLFFHLQQQQLIELIRGRHIEEALKYAQEHLAERGEEDEEVLPELERTLALLAFDEPEKSPFGDLIHPSRRQKIASEVNASILEMESRCSTTRLEVLMKLMLCAQDGLVQKKVKYPPGMTDISQRLLEDPK